MKTFRPWVVLVGVVLTAGCGSQTVPVKGTVTVNGKPLANASVQFLNQDGGKDARGFTNADGEFELTTFQPKDGAMPGQYKITVTYSEPVKVEPSPYAEDVQKAMQQAGASAKPGLTIPPKYSQPDQTILKHRVPDDGDAKLELSVPAP
jgi:hypothetical protein